MDCKTFTTLYKDVWRYVTSSFDTHTCCRCSVSVSGSVTALAGVRLCVTLNSTVLALQSMSC